VEICGDGIVRVDTPRAPTFSIEVRALASPAIAENWKMSLAGIDRNPARCTLAPSATFADDENATIGSDCLRSQFSIELPPCASDSCHRCYFPKNFLEKKGAKIFDIRTKNFFSKSFWVTIKKVANRNRPTALRSGSER
jgi:hypothetical protein